MRIGPEQWHWVSIDTVGVPTGGKYGDVQRFAAKIAPHGLKLAWKQQWDCFVMYEVRGDEYIPHVTFKDWSTMKPIPVRDEHIRTFLAMRKLYPTQPTIEFAMKQHDAKLKYEKQVEMRQAREDRREALMRATDLSMGFVTPRALIVVP